MKIRPLEIFLIIVFIGLLIVVGQFIGNDLTRQSAAQDPIQKPSREHIILTQPTVEQPRSNHGFTKSQKHSEELGQGHRYPNERLVRFNSRADFEDFLKRVKNSRLQVLGSLEALNAVRLGFNNLADFKGFVDESALTDNFFITLPSPTLRNGAEGDATGFNGNALEWLGITTDNSDWGRGVKVAIIDSGIQPHSALPPNIQVIDLVNDGVAVSEWHGHGSAVASLIIGQNGITPGVAPASEVIGIRIADTSGISSSFQLAQGIIAAVNSGAQVISISMGGFGESNLVNDAIAYATDNGSIIVASPGNDGAQQVASPASHPDTIAVGAVGHNGTLADFSNIGDAIDITAPGLELYVTWTQNRYAEASGTSFSAPLFSAAIAAVMSQFDINAPTAAAMVLRHANEAGQPGNDPEYGHGHLDIGRVMNSETRGIHDLASVFHIVNRDSQTLTTIVQNQGTEFIHNASATITTPDHVTPVTIPRLAPGEIQVFESPFTPPPAGEAYSIETTTFLPPSFQDAEPTNNSKSSLFNNPLIP